MAENGNEKALNGDVQKRQVSRQCHSISVSERSRTGCKEKDYELILVVGRKSDRLGLFRSVDRMKNDRQTMQDQREGMALIKPW